jgi:hypothetical protein
MVYYRKNPGILRDPHGLVRASEWQIVAQTIYDPSPPDDINRYLFIPRISGDSLSIDVLRGRGAITSRRFNWVEGRLVTGSQSDAKPLTTTRDGDFQYLNGRKDLRTYQAGSNGDPTYVTKNPFITYPSSNVQTPR